METSQEPAEKSSSLLNAYCLVSVVRCKAPDIAAGNNWFCYTLNQGKSSITGYRQGTKEEVTLAAEDMVLRLNERRTGKSGRGPTTSANKANKANKKA